MTTACALSPEGYTEQNTATPLRPALREKRTYTVAEIRAILGISRPTAYNLIKQENFRSVHVGGHIRISKKSFDAWLDELE